MNNNCIFNTCGRTECVAEQKRLMERICELEVALREIRRLSPFDSVMQIAIMALGSASEDNEIQAQEG